MCVVLSVSFSDALAEIVSNIVSFIPLWLYLAFVRLKKKKVEENYLFPVMIYSYIFIERQRFVSI